MRGKRERERGGGGKERRRERAAIKKKKQEFFSILFSSTFFFFYCFTLSFRLQLFVDNSRSDSPFSTEVFNKIETKKTPLSISQLLLFSSSSFLASLASTAATSASAAAAATQPPPTPTPAHPRNGFLPPSHDRVVRTTLLVPPYL